MWRTMKTVRSRRFSVSGELKLHLDLRNFGGNGSSDSRYGAWPTSVAVRADGMIFTSACDHNTKTEFWAFDKFGNKIWNPYVSFGNNRGIVAISQKGRLCLVFENIGKYRRFRSSYRAGPLLEADGFRTPC